MSAEWAVPCPTARRGRRYTERVSSGRVSSAPHLAQTRSGAAHLVVGEALAPEDPTRQVQAAAKPYAHRLTGLRATDRRRLTTKPLHNPSHVTSDHVCQSRGAQEASAQDDGPTKHQDERVHFSLLTWQPPAKPADVAAYS